MPTFRWNSEHPYYKDGQMVKKVRSQHNLEVSAVDCAILGFTAMSLLGKLAL
jgi:hypothetical protein